MRSEQELVRCDKLERLKSAGIDPYPEGFKQTHSLKEAMVLADGAEPVRIAGRITSIRKLGKLSFVHLQDLEGKVQLCIKIDDLGADRYAQFSELTDIGDFIGASGVMFTTRVGEKTLQVHDYQFLGKCLRPLPEKWHGLTDVELRYRQRYLDLVMNEETRKRFLLRTTLLRELRRFLEDQNFLEVETTTLQPNPSGALAKPFKTHHNALGIDLFLRIAPETYLKRLIVGGFHHIFEVARCFRNEGISPYHLQEFTMVEGYSAYWSYRDNMDLMRKLFQHLIQKTLGTLEVTIEGKLVNFAGDWGHISFRDLLLKDCGIDIDQHMTAKSLLAAIEGKGIELEDAASLGRGNLIDTLYKKVSRPKISGPVFLVEHPIDLSPLARANSKNPLLTDRFQLVVNGVELVNAYSELVDPVEQQKRLEEQASLNAAGDQEAMVTDEDYVIAMEFGMPPISGWGIGIDRLVQLLTGVDNIKDCVLFPLARKVSAT